MIFNGSLEHRSSSTSGNLIAFLKQALEDKGIEIMVFQLAEASIPLFDISLKNTPLAVQGMVQVFVLIGSCLKVVGKY